VPRWDERSAECRVLVFKEGMLSAVGHDLELRVTRLVIEAAEDRSSVDGRFDARSLRVVTALERKGPLDARAPSWFALVAPAPGLDEADRRRVEAHIVDDVLGAARYPEIRFRSTRVTAAGDGYQIPGQLTVRGRTRELSFASTRIGDRQVAELRLHQPDFGITPFQALFGALRVRPEVQLRISVPA
jgi:hypothetical protein